MLTEFVDLAGTFNGWGTDPLTPMADADGDSITYSYAWTVGGSSASPTGSTRSSAYFDRGDTVTCTLTIDQMDDRSRVKCSALFSFFLSRPMGTPPGHRTEHR